MVADNNNAEVAIDLVDRPLRIAYFDGYPRWEYRYIKNSLMREKTIDVSCWLTSAEETFALTGFWPGGVCPFGVSGIPVYIDQSLAQWEKIFPAAGTNSTGVPMTYAQLLAVAGGSVCDVASDPAGA